MASQFFALQALDAAQAGDWSLFDAIQRGDANLPPRRLRVPERVGAR